MKILQALAAAMFGLGLACPSHAAETVMVSHIPKGCAAIVDEQADGTVVVFLRCKGQIDWVLYWGKQQ